MALFDFRRTPSPVSVEKAEPLRLVSTQPGLIPMEDLLRLVVDEGASDLHISVGTPPAVRLGCCLVKLDSRTLTPDDTEALARSIDSEGHLQKVQEEGSVDFGFSIRERIRFR